MRNGEDDLGLEDGLLMLELGFRFGRSGDCLHDGLSSCDFRSGRFSLGRGSGFEGRSDRAERLPKKRPLRGFVHSFAENSPEEKKADDKRVVRESVYIALRDAGEGIKELQAGRVSIRGLHGFSSGRLSSASSADVR